MSTATQTKADKINAALADGCTVVVATNGRATEYSAKHVGWFFMKGDNLYVKHGKSSNCLSFGGIMLVSIKAYK